MRLYRFGALAVLFLAVPGLASILLSTACRRANRCAQGGLRMGKFVYALALGFVIAGTGCSEVGSTIDCHKICNRYKDCVDSNYDVDNCESRCQADSSDKDKDAALEKAADDCEKCQDDKACAENGQCAVACASIVP